MARRSEGNWCCDLVPLLPCCPRHAEGVDRLADRLELRVARNAVYLHVVGVDLQSIRQHFCQKVPIGVEQVGGRPQQPAHAVYCDLSHRTPSTGSATAPAAESSTQRPIYLHVRPCLMGQAASVPAIALAPAGAQRLTPDPT